MKLFFEMSFKFCTCEGLILLGSRAGTGTNGSLQACHVTGRPGPSNRPSGHAWAAVPARGLARLIAGPRQAEPK
jgi:hypothetical protein